MTIRHQTNEPSTYSTTDVQALTGASFRMLDFWVRRGYIQMPATGSGRPRRWNDNHVATAFKLKTASDLRRTFGCSFNVPLTDLVA